MEKGIVFDIKEFAVFDGPGMRQTVFLKGCPLRCNWCHNPEGISNAPQKMMTNQGSRMVGKEMSSEELIQMIRKDSSYYERYNGGVTFSGGEPLMQANFLTEVLKNIFDLHRAIETSGYAEEKTFLEVIKYVDFIMIDLKIFDNALHKQYTGVDNTVILNNIKILCGEKIPFIIRIPVIPGVNDNEDNYRNTAKWVAGAEALEKVELLSYHKTAGAKYGMLGKKYQPKFEIDRRIWISQEIFTEHGIRSEIL